jgi:hypothetical protein
MKFREHADKLGCEFMTANVLEIRTSCTERGELRAASVEEACGGAEDRFLVETDSAALLFDWWKGELPAVKPGVPLYVFASHAHPDHRSSRSMVRPGRSEARTPPRPRIAAQASSVAPTHPAAARAITFPAPYSAVSRVGFTR